MTHSYASSHTLLPGKQIAYNVPDAYGQPTGFTPSDGPVVAYAWQQGLLHTVTAGSQSFTATNNSVISATRWLYDGWNPVAEYSLQTSSLILQTSYLWGLDISGTLTDAGGVGGLLAVITSNPTTVYHPSFDGNGNITAWTLSGATVPVCRREYDAFGNIVVEQGTAPCAFGFSTKLEDPETHLLFYGYRYYDPLTGRWPSRDPIEEKGGLNLYGFVANDGVNWVDYLGQGDNSSGTKTVKRKCESTIVAGHGWHTAPSAIEAKFPQRPEPGDRCTAVGCFSGDINNRHPGAVSYEGEVFWDPTTPDFVQTNTNNQLDPDGLTQNTNQTGYLWSGLKTVVGPLQRIERTIVDKEQAESAYSALVSAVEAAKLKAEEDCKEKDCPCKSVKVRVICIWSRFLDFDKLTAILKSPVLCGKEYLYDCSKKEWVDSSKLP